MLAVFEYAVAYQTESTYNSIHVTVPSASDAVAENGIVVPAG